MLNIEKIKKKIRNRAEKNLKRNTCNEFYLQKKNLITEDENGSKVIEFVYILQ